MYLKKIKKNIVILFLGPLAQLVEHFPFKEGVIGSNPIRLTKLNLKMNIKIIDNFYLIRFNFLTLHMVVTNNHLISQLFSFFSYNFYLTLLQKLHYFAKGV